MKQTNVLLIGRRAKQTTTPPPPAQKLREYAHLQKFKEFKLGEFPWTHSNFGVHGRKGGWLWADAKQQVAERLIRESRHVRPEVHRYAHPQLPPQERRLEVPQAAAAVLAAHLRGRPGGYGVAPEQQNVPVTVHSEKPELDAAKNDEPRTARVRWAEHRKVVIHVDLHDLDLTPHARRRFEAAYHDDYMHESTITISCDNYEDFWDNYEWATTKLNQMIADAKRADIDPVYRPMEQYKVRESGYERAVDSVHDWYTLQAQSLALGEKYAALKDAGAETVTGFNLYETPAYAVYNAERAARKTLDVQLAGVEDGYSVDRMSAAIGQVRAQAYDLEEETDEEAGNVLEGAQVQDVDMDFGAVEESVKAGKKKAKAKEEEESVEDLFADFVSPSENDK
eukprot:TRINITY_DN1985_c0_g7_i1.p1 TRINITY_DN1985_c0_g7~~TRINITY_DN1985_c0_g7_i1.p1  ORF type:complete len:395 (+),score=175.22 TRINITY_DN1985_c0_g7_i1:44-1228(+)